MTIQNLIDKYNAEIDRLDEDMRGTHDAGGYRAGKQTMLIMVVNDLKALQTEKCNCKAWCEEIADKEDKT